MFLDRRIRALSLTLTLAGVAVCGCQHDSTPRTPGEKTQMQGKMIEEAGSTRQKGEDMVVDGKGKVARGQQMIAQGKAEEGKALSTEGESEVRQGQVMIREAEQMKDSALNMPVTTAPTTMPKLP